MAKLTNRQKANILAKWNTGEYTKTQLAKTYKVTEKVIRNITGLEKPSNANIVEAGVILETLKKSEKSTIEQKAINHAIEQRLKIDFEKDNLKVKVFEAQLKAIDKIKDLLDNGSYSKPIKTKNGDYDIVQNVEHDLTPSDVRTCIEGVDKASISLGVNERFSSSQLTLNNQNNNQVENKNINIVVEA